MGRLESNTVTMKLCKKGWTLIKGQNYNGTDESESTLIKKKN